jgi:hypothetical protein
MKTYTLVIVLSVISLAGFSQSLKNGRTVTSSDSIAMGASYANDIYYSFENGVVASPARNTWDIGFRTSIWTADIITNDGYTVKLYTYPKSDTTGWNAVDTTGLGSWPVMYNDENDWENGAFTRNQLGHPDYGWGKYNPINHDVVGDSIYIIKTLAGSWFKVWILRKNSIANTYYIRFANLDGSNQKDITLDINPYQGKNFAYYSFDNSQLIDREPDTASWDVLFTKYIGIQPNGTPYPVVGVFNNTKVYANKFEAVGPDFFDWSSQPLDSTKSPIGWSWKSYSMNTNSWNVADSTAFFVETWDRNIYKLVFTKFEGLATGKIVFESTLQSPSAIISPEKGNATVSVYPNPVTDHFIVNFSNVVSDKVTISVYDMTGKVVFQDEQVIDNNSTQVRLHEAGLQNGLYVLGISTGSEVYTSKFMISKF